MVVLRENIDNVDSIPESTGQRNWTCMSGKPPDHHRLPITVAAPFTLWRAHLTQPLGSWSFQLLRLELPC